MSRRARLEALARQRAATNGGTPITDDAVAIVAGWCQADTDVDATKTITHDHLLELMGDRRRSGVTWRVYAGFDAVEAIDAMVRDSTGTVELRRYYRDIRSKLMALGGFLVLASARGQL